MAKLPVVKTSLLHLSVEEENLAAIPFAVLERRVGKRIPQIEIKGSKILPDGSEMRVSWQVQGSSELGLPIEQDLDIFVALGVLTFRNDFSKTVTFTGREIARILGIHSVHGKFYQRLKVAMGRFIPLRFRAITETDRQEDVKWLNVFQEASFTLDRETGRCTGTITWTDKLIQSMNHGFFRVLDASRYMELDGITAKHLYRFLAVVFEKTDLVVIDARKLATEHLGILKVPYYLSRLMQTLEPAFEQLVRVNVLGSFHVVDAEKWEIALRRHEAYVPERKTLLDTASTQPTELLRTHCQRTLECAGMSAKTAAKYCDSAQSRIEFYQLERAARLLQAMLDEGVLASVALGVVKKALDAGAATAEGTDALDWTEIAIETCRTKQAFGQRLKNPAGMIVCILKDPEARERIVDEEAQSQACKRYRARERNLLAEERYFEQRELVLEYEQYRREVARTQLDELSDLARQALRREKLDILKQQERLDRLDPAARDREVDELILQDLARKESAPFEKWYLRKRAQQTVLPFVESESAIAG